MVKRKKTENTGSDKPPKLKKIVETQHNGLEPEEIQQVLDVKIRKFVKETKSLLNTQQTLLTGLTKLRDALRSSKSSDPALFQEFIRENSECPELFKVLEKGRQQQSQLELQMTLEVLEYLLLFTAESDHRSVGPYLVQRILRNHLKLLYSYLNPASPAGLIKAVLRLLVAMVTQGVSAAREMQTTFDFTLKALGALPHKRDFRAVQDIRTCFIHFTMSFLMFGDDAVIKHILDIKGFVSSIFKGLPSDSPDVIYLVLSTLKQKVVHNTCIPKKTKVQFFSPFLLTQLTNLYQYKDEKEGESDSVQAIRETVHNILVEICCTFKYGICFANNLGMLASRSNNPVLLRFLQSMPKTMGDLLVQSLVIKTLTCCPDLLQPYLSSMSATYEPRLSIPWLTNINFIIKLYSALPLPSITLKRSDMKLNTAAVSSVVNTVIPVVITRSSLSHGIQHTSPLVKHTTLVLLVLILDRAVDVLGFCDASSSSYTQDNSTGSSFVELFREAVMKSLPDVKTVISLRQNLVAGSDQKKSQDSANQAHEDDDNSEESGSTGLDKEVPSILLLTRALQAMLGYQKLQPLIFSGTGFDLGKLLPGQQDLSDSVFPPIVQYLTLQILLKSPTSTFKWLQQKTKSGPSCMYSILKLFVQTTSESNRTLARHLIIKFLHNTGLFEKDAREVEIWLKHLTTQTYNPDQDALLLFLDEVCRSVGSEPYTYTDVVMEIASESAARQASEEISSVFQLTTEDLNEIKSGSPSSRLPFSALVVRALMLHIQSVLQKVNEGSYMESAVKHCPVARYLNLVILDILRGMVDPLPLCFAIRRYYDDVAVIQGCATLTTIHCSLLEHAYLWSGDTYNNELGEDHVDMSDLEYFLVGKAAYPSPDSLFKLLAPLNESHWHKVLARCLGLCLSSMDGDLSPLVQHLMVKPYNTIESSEDIDSMIHLLKALPFGVLLWQVFSSKQKRAKKASTSTEHKLKQMETESETNQRWLKVVQHPGIQELLLDSLQRENPCDYQYFFHQVLFHLAEFIRGALNGRNTREQEHSRAVIGVSFQLLQVMIEKGILSAVNSRETHVDSDQSSFHLEKNQIPHLTPELIRTIPNMAMVQHPLLLKCFLLQQSNNDSNAAVVSSLTHSIANLLMAVREMLPVDQSKCVLAPYMNKLCDGAMAEILQAQDNLDLEETESLQLLNIFHSSCEKKKLSTLVTSLLQLPFTMLVTKTSKTDGGLEPTSFCRTLLTFLDAQPDHVTSLQSSTTSRHVMYHDGQLTNRDTLLSGPSFERIVALLEVAPCSQLDSIVCKILRRSPEYVLVVTSSLLDCCLDNPTEERVAIATTLLSSSSSLRGHFQRRCLARVGDNAFEECRPLGFDKHLVELLPVVHTYLSDVKGRGKGFEGLSSFDGVCIVSERYMPYLWTWLFGEKKGAMRTQEDCLAVLRSLIRLQTIETKDLRQHFSKLLQLTASQSWDVYQSATARELLGCLLVFEDSRDVLVARMVYACMASLSRSMDTHTVDNTWLQSTLKTFIDILSSDCKVQSIRSEETDSEVWNAFVKDCLRHGFDCNEALRSIALCVQLLYSSNEDTSATQNLIPLTTLYQLILSHSHFLEVMLSDATTEKTVLKEAVLNLLVAIVELCPECCEASHLTVLFGAYSASLNKTDQTILYLLHLYEKSSVSLSSWRPYVWGKAALDHHKTRKQQPASLWQQPSTNEVLELLDVQQMNRSAMNFPIERLLQPQLQGDLCGECKEPSSYYDPCFLIPLFSHILAPNSEVDCRKFVERGGLGFTAAALSSRDQHMRKAAAHVLSRCFTHVEGARFREKKQVQLLLECLKNGITEVDARVSSVITRFIARASHILLRPDHAMYILVNSSLLQRSAMDLKEVPLFYTLFNSSSMQHRSERTWILQLLVEGLRDAPDYYVYKRRHVMELALSYHDSQMSDLQSRELVINLLSAGLSIHAAAFDMARNYGMVTWIHSLALQSKSSNNREGLGSSLGLLHTLWFTIQEGKPSTGVCSTEVSGETEKKVPLPPNLAQECLLVCKTLLESLRVGVCDTDACSFLELIYSVLRHLDQVAPQDARISYHDIISILTLWCRVFNEMKFLKELSLELEIPLDSAMQPSIANYCRNDANCETSKQTSFVDLLNLLTLWKPASTSDKDSCRVELLACVFGLHFLRNYADNNRTIARPKSSLIHRILTWFRQCVASQQLLQFGLLSQQGETCIQHLLQLYGLHEEAVSSRQEHLNELNITFLVLLLRAQNIGDVTPGKTASKVIELTSRNVYRCVVSSGLMEVLLPLCPSPLAGDGTGIGEDQTTVSELLSVLLQEIWFNKPVPRHFLTLLLRLGEMTNEGGGLDVVTRLVSALGGTKKITEWIKDTS